MKGSQSESEKIRKMAVKNQQRCLNSLSFNRKRAYLSRDKCKSKKFFMEEDEGAVKWSGEFFDDDNQKFKTQELNKLISNPAMFDPSCILKQIDYVNVAIKQIENKNNNNSQSKLYKSPKTKTSHSTREASFQSPKSIDIDRLKAKKYFTTDQEKEKKPLSQSRPQSKEYLNSSCRLSGQKFGDRNMMKMKSRKKMVKVYNPFPTPMAQIL